ncbi:MAG: PEPxxWA-CTERM sorting domain-containing protein [Sphingomonas sp.]
MALRSIAIAIAVLAASASGSAIAQTTVYDTSLANLNGTSGPVTATTTTDANGTVTTVTGPSGGAFRASASPDQSIKDKWSQANVGASGSVGITKTYAQSGNGSVYFDGTNSGSKADIEYYFSSPVALSDFASASFDWFRDSSSTNSGVQLPSFRLLVNNAGGSLSQSTALIFERVYNVAGNAPTDSWQTSSIDLNSIFWNNSGLNSPGATYSTLASWIAANPSMQIYGLSVGIGSGWEGHFTGAVDNIAFDFGGKNQGSFNFEVAGVPEPAAWGMMIGGFGLVGGALRRRKQVTAAA